MKKKEKKKRRCWLFSYEAERPDGKYSRRLEGTYRYDPESDGIPDDDSYLGPKKEFTKNDDYDGGFDPYE
ncbi:MAG: hypothetical protein ACOX40_00740 [Bacilli bacterium]|jgi:hypothetical protein